MKLKTTLILRTEMLKKVIDPTITHGYEEKTFEKYVYRHQESKENGNKQQQMKLF